MNKKIYTFNNHKSRVDYKSRVNYKTKIKTFKLIDLIIQGKIEHIKYGNYKNVNKDIKELIIKDTAKDLFKYFYTKVGKVLLVSRNKKAQSWNN